MARLRTIHIAAGLLLGTACADNDPGAIYRLVRADNDTLPVLLQQDADCRHMLMGGEVKVHGRQQFVSTYDIRIFCGDQPAQRAPIQGTTGRIRIDRDTAFFSDSIGRPTGRGILTADSLKVQGSTRELVYRRELPRR